VKFAIHLFGRNIVIIVMNIYKFMLRQCW